MKKQTIIITGCDSNFYSFLEECLQSLLNLNLENKADIGILDLGLTAIQIDELSSKGFIIKKPVWPDFVPSHLRDKHHNVGLVARTQLREYFEGYNTYLWFDADAWAQTPEFFETLVVGSRTQGAVVIREDGPNYKRDFVYTKWWYGNMIKSYGLIDGIKVAAKPSINIGIMCLSDTSELWKAWQDTYIQSMKDANKINMDQHAFNAALELENLSYYKAPARCNWQPVLSVPVWNPIRKMLCEPDKAAIPLSVVHLAGPNKKNPYVMNQTTGGSISSPLTYSAVKSLCEGHEFRIKLGQTG